MGCHLPVFFEREDHGGHPVEEVAVVTNDERSRLALDEHLFECGEGRHVEVVGGLVEHQYVRRDQQHLRERSSGPLTTRKRRHAVMRTVWLE